MIMIEKWMDGFKDDEDDGKDLMNFGKMMEAVES